MLVSYTIRYSHRKTISIRVLHSQEVLISAPYLTPKSYIDNFVQSKQKRIQKTQEKYKNYQPIIKQYISQEKKEQAIIQILPRIEYYAELMNLQTKYGTIKITNAQGKRGSCSST